MNDTFEFQAKFVAQLKSVISPSLSIAEELADLLMVSTDSVYRRLRCQSAFTFDEIARIATKFGISIDGLLQLESTQVTFNFNPMFEDNSNFGNYFAGFAKYLAELSKIPSARIIYAAEDVPVFRHFKYPTLSAFKSFYWSKAVLNSNLFIGKKFNSDMVPPEMIDFNRTTFNNYCNIDRIEIWSEETLSSTLKQVEFFWESGLFDNKEQAIKVISDIRQMMNDLQEECNDEAKELPGTKGKFMLYNCEVFIGNNCVLIEPGESQFLERIFLGYNTFNSISTYNIAFSRETRLWMENLIKKSVQLSGTGEKQRSRFFNRMDEKISQLEKDVLATNP